MGDRAREQMGVLNAHLSLTAPIYITLSNLRLEGTINLQYEQPYLYVKLKGESGEHALKNVKVNSSFDGCSASEAVARSVYQSLQNFFNKLTHDPLRIRL